MKKSTVVALAFGIVIGAGVVWQAKELADVRTLQLIAQHTCALR